MKLNRARRESKSVLHKIFFQAREDAKARERAEEREQLERQKQELHAKFRRVPPMLHSHNRTRKDSVQREADLDVSENLLVSPVRSRKEEQACTEVEDVVSFKKRNSKLEIQLKLP